MLIRTQHNWGVLAGIVSISPVSLLKIILGIK
jgi:hypothetical protein